MMQTGHSGGGFGRLIRPSQETKIDETKESQNVLRWFWIGFFITLAIQVALYAALNVFFGDWDWNALFTSFIIFGHTIMYLRVKLGPRFRQQQFSDLWYIHLGFATISVIGVYWSGWQKSSLTLLIIMVVYTMTCLWLHREWRTRWWIGWLFVLSSTLVSIAAVPILVHLFNYEAGLIPFWDGISGSSIVLMLSISVAIPGAVLLYRVLFEMGDRYHAPLEPRIVELQTKGKLAEMEKGWELKHRLPPTDNSKMPALVRAKTKRRLSDAERWQYAMSAFVVGINNGSIGNTERDWSTRDILGESGIPLTVGNGRKMRGYLIEAGLMDWTDPTNHNLGIKLADMNVDEILQYIGVMVLDDQGDETSEENEDGDNTE